MEFNGKKILVTGGTGFIGSHLAAALAEDNQVWVTGRSGQPKDLSKNITFAGVDITTEGFHELIKHEQFDAIFHFAANVDPHRSVMEPWKDFEANLLATFTLLETLRGLKKKPSLIFASSVAVYGSCKDKKLSEDSSVPAPISPYGVSKLAAEKYVYVYARDFGIPAISLRIFSTYGPGLRRQVVYDFIDKLAKNPAKLEIIGDGSQARDLVFIDDQVANIIKVSEGAQYTGEVYNLGSAELYTTKDIAMAVIKGLDIKPEIVFTGEVRKSDGQTWRADIAKMKKLGGQINVSLVAGISKTVAWYRQG
jgi:UDP-glucose 4-epimerase